MRGIRRLLVAGAWFLVGCAGKATNTGDGAAGASGGPDGTSGSVDGAQAGTSNGAITPELRATGLPLGSVLGQLPADAQTAVCRARGQWLFRLRDPICYAFVESAVVMMPRTQDEDRALCEEGLPVCHKPTEPTPPCVSYPGTCLSTVGDLDRCLVESEQWYDVVPTCQEMTRANAAYQIGPSPASCLALYDASCLESRR